MDRTHRMGKPVTASRLLLQFCPFFLAVPVAMAEPSSPEAAAILTAQAGEGASRAVRQIAPELVAPPQVDDGDLRRTDPRAPLSEIGPAAASRQRTDGKADANMIFGPVATAAGRIEAGGVVIAVAGIEIVEPDQTCRGRDGDWPCGMMARTAFRSFLRGRALDCDMPEGEVPARVSVSCRLGTQDLGAWLVSNGWAKVSSTGPYAEEQNEALAARRGIFGSGPERLPAAADGSTTDTGESAPLLVTPPSGEFAAPVSEPAVAEPAPAPAPAAIEPFLGEPKGLY